MSDDIEPIVVDSPLPAGGTSAPPSLESVMGLPEANTAADDRELTLEPLPVEKAVEKTGPTAADEIAQLSTIYGRDLSRFKDVESAKAAGAMLLEDYVNIGLESGDDVSAEAAPPTVKTEPPAADDFPELDEATTDPAVVKAFKALKAKAEANDKRYADLEQREKQQAAQQAQALQKQVDTMSIAHMSKINPEVFGEPGKQTPLQRIAAKNTLEIVNSAIKGMAARGVKGGVTIEALTEAVLNYTGQKGTGAPAKLPANTPFSLPPKTPAGGSPQNVQQIYVSEGNDPNGYFKNPKIRALFLEALKG